MCCRCYSLSSNGFFTNSGPSMIIINKSYLFDNRCFLVYRVSQKLQILRNLSTNFRLSISCVILWCQLTFLLLNISFVILSAIYSCDRKTTNDYEVIFLINESLRAWVEFYVLLFGLILKVLL